MNKNEARLQELIEEYGIERIVTWSETRLKAMKRMKDPARLQRQYQREREKRAQERQELETLRARLKDVTDGRASA